MCVGDIFVRSDPDINEPICVSLVGIQEGTETIRDETQVTVQFQNGTTEEGPWSSFRIVPMQYGVVSGSEKTDRESMIQLFRSKRNKKGIDAAILMITKAGAEGLDLKSVR